MSAWTPREAALCIICPRCGAKVGQPCPDATPEGREFTPPMERLRDEYVKMRAELYGFADLYAAEFDRSLAQRDARIKAEARREAVDAIDAWEAQESVDVLTGGAWSDGVRYGLMVARQIVSGDDDD